MCPPTQSHVVQQTEKKERKKERKKEDRQIYNRKDTCRPSYLHVELSIK